MVVERHRLSEQIARTLGQPPSEPALEYDERWYSWGDLAAAAARIDDLVDAGFAEDPVVVGVLVRNSPMHVAALLAILRRGGCFVVINPARGREGLRADVAQLGLRLVIGTTADIDVVRRAAEETAFVGFRGLEPEPEAAPVEPFAEASPAHPGVAVRMPTSGTTGPPKRIDLTYDALDATMAGVTKRYSSTSPPAPAAAASRGVAIVNSPLAHLGGVFRVLQCVLDGRRFVLLDRFEMDPWLRAMREYRPKTVSLVPTALRMVLEADPDPADLASLVAVTSGTAPLSPDDADAFTSRFGVPVLTSYAATEFAGGVAGWTLQDYRRYWAEKRGSVGRAQPGCGIRIADENTGEELPRGREGLLEVKPAQLGPDTDWIRTTDVARIDADGFLYIIGRADRAIIRGGFKVLPDHVQAVLERQAGVRTAVVLGIPDERLGAVPVALIEPSPGASADVEAIRAGAASSLARYELPVDIHIVAEFPRTPAGKVDLPAAQALLAEVHP